MKIEFKTWGEETITLEGQVGGYVKLTIKSKDSDLPVEMSTTLMEEDLYRLVNSVGMIQ